MQASGDGAPIRATVKWFNTAKGFGFVTPADGSAEAFLHLSALRQAGFESIGEGAGLVVELGQSPKGRQVVRVVEVDPGAATPARGDSGGGDRGGFRDRGDRGGFGGGDRGGFGGGDRGGFGGGDRGGFGGGDRGGFGGGDRGGFGGGGGGDRGGFGGGGGGDRGGFGGAPRGPRSFGAPAGGGGFGGGAGAGAGAGGPGAYQAPSPADIARAEPMDGVVKWFSGLKGYGFIQPNSGGKDVFLHITVLRNAGIESLNPGQAVRMKVLTAKKGPEAVSIEAS